MRRLAPSSLRLHQLADLVPEMPSQQWTGFVGDVAERGILTPLVLAADGRTVLDGRHRLKAALELGLTQVPTTVVDLEGRTEVDYMVRSALHRRHLTDDQRAILASRAAEERGDDRRGAAAQTAANSRWHPDASGSPATTTHEPSRSREEVARSFGVATRKVRQAHGLRVVAPELADKVLAGEMRLKEADVLWRRRCQLEAIRALPEPALDERAQILLGDFRQLSEEIEADSVDMILTDPPYTHVALPVWEDLGELAARILRPGGFLVAYSGHMYLDQVMAALSRHLSYWWLCCIPFRGPKPSVHDRQVRTGFRTVLVYVKPPIGERPWFFDVVDGDRAPDKRFHDWGQSVKPARYFVSRFSSQGDLVLDPFCGAGAFPEAAVLEGRRTLGMEVHPAHVEVSRKRVGLALAGAPLQNPSGTDGGGGEGQDEG